MLSWLNLLLLFLGTYILFYTFYLSDVNTLKCSISQLSYSATSPQRPYHISNIQNEMPKRKKSNLQTSSSKKRNRRNKQLTISELRQSDSPNPPPISSSLSASDEILSSRPGTSADVFHPDDTHNSIRRSPNPVSEIQNNDVFHSVADVSEKLNIDLTTYANVGSIYEGIKCTHCGAYRFSEERLGFCCSNGKVRPPVIPELPPDLLDLYDDDQFLNNIRFYNNAFAMASLGCKEIYTDGFSPTVQIHGKIHHMIGPLKPSGTNKPVYSQLYFYDVRFEQEYRASLSNNLRPATLEKIQNCLHRCDFYIQEFKRAKDIAAVVGDVNIVFSNNGPDKTYSLPVNDQIAAVASNITSQADIIFSTLNGSLKRISELHRMYDPLHYILFFPYGTDGFKLGLEKGDKRKMTAEDYYLYQLQVRDETIKNNSFLRSRRLTQQFVCDQFIKIEKSRLNWIRNNQGTLRAEKYQGLLDAIDMSDNVINEAIGRRVILPPTFYGSPRWYSNCFQDCMAMVRTFGSPDLFITMTCNPDWKEITDSLGEGEKAGDRPDISVRVFQAKLKRFLRLITTNALFGKVAAYTSMVEYQKRGLPHAHILLIMASDSKIRDPSQVDKIISAEIPDANINAKLYEVITKFNIHGPCGKLRPQAPCNKGGADDGACKKGYPTAFNNEGTNINPKLHYPQYLRRDEMHGGRTVKKYVNGKELILDNRWVVPYNPVLSEVFEAHINVEVVMSLGAVKYLYKYVTKGSDKVLFSIRDSNVDEVEMFEVGRFVSATEAFWRIYQFKINTKHPNVRKLPIHLPKEQLVYFDPDNVEEAIADEEPKTELTAFFELNQRDRDANNLLYPDILKHYTWQPGIRGWQRRRRNLTGTDCPSDTIGRIPIINLNPKQEELYYLRICLHHITGPTSFEALRTVEGVLYSTFKEACVALGVLEDDKELSKALERAETITFGQDLRELFGTILTHGNPLNASLLWDEHKEQLVQDYIRQNGGQREITDDDYNRAKFEIQLILDSFGLDLQRNFGISYNADWRAGPLTENTNSVYDIPTLEHIAEDNLQKLTNEQREAFDAITESIEKDEGQCFALDAPGGTGKTFLITTVLATVRAKKMTAIATATSGIAATLLDCGRTLHSALKVPIDIDDSSTCNITPRDKLAEQLRQL